jgi:hypothetical protein
MSYSQKGKLAPIAQRARTHACMHTRTHAHTHKRSACSAPAAGFCQIFTFGDVKKRVYCVILHIVYEASYVFDYC